MEKIQFLQQLLQFIQFFFSFKILQLSHIFLTHSLSSNAQSHFEVSYCDQIEINFICFVGKLINRQFQRKQGRINRSNLIQRLKLTVGLKLQEQREMKESTSMIPPYNRISLNGLTMITTNPCNDFIIEYLLASKLKFAKQSNIRNSSHNFIMEQVRNYPMPIICQAQMKGIEGFGDFYVDEIKSLIKRHYSRGRMPTPEEMIKQDNIIRLSIRKIRKIHGGRGKNQYYTQEDLFSKFSQNLILGKREEFKPKVNSEGFNILRAMHKLRAHFEPVTKGEINEKLFDENIKKIQFWVVISNKLKIHGYLRFDDDDMELIHLTQKGVAFIEETHIENQVLGASKYNPEDLALYTKFTVLQDEEQKGYVMKKVKKWGMEFQISQFLIGDYMWCVKEKVLNLIVFRIDALNMSDDEFQFLFWKARLFPGTKIFFMFQFPEIQSDELESVQKQKKQISKRLYDYMIALRSAGFAVIKVFYGYSQVWRWIKVLTEDLKEKLIKLKKDIKPMPYMGNFTQITQKSLMVSFLSCIPEFSMSHIHDFWKENKIECMRALHDSLNKLKNQPKSERRKFYNWMAFDLGWPELSMRTLVGILLQNDYEKKNIE